MQQLNNCCNIFRTWKYDFHIIILHAHVFAFWTHPSVEMSKFNCLIHPLISNNQEKRVFNLSFSLFLLGFEPLSIPIESTCAHTWLLPPLMWFYLDILLLFSLKQWTRTNLLKEKMMMSWTLEVQNKQVLQL